MKQHVARAIAFAVMMTVVVVSFQNCQDFSVSEEVLASEYQIQSHSAQDVSTYAKLMVLDELVGIYISERASYVGTTFNKVTNTHASLFAPGSVFDLSAKTVGKVPVPSPDEIRGRIFLSQSADSGGAAVLMTPNTDVLMSEEFTVFVVLRTPTNGKILSIGTGVAMAQEVGLSISGTTVEAYHSSSSGNVAKVIGTVEDGADAIVIAASFGIAANRMQLMVNGRLFDQATNTGSPAALTLVQRGLELGPGTTGQVVTWGEARLFARRLGPYDLSVISRRLAADWKVGGVIDDISLRTMADRSLVDFDEVEPVQDPRFAAAQAALDAKCASCHYHASWAGKNATFYFSSARAVKGSPDSSPLYYRLTASSAPALSGSKNMPQSPGPAMTPAEVEAIRDWIQNAP